MTKEPKMRKTFYLEHEPFAVLGIEPTSAALNGTLGLFADLIEDAGGRVAKLFTRAEWNYLAECFGNNDFGRWEKWGTVGARLTAEAVGGVYEPEIAAAFGDLGGEPGFMALTNKLGQLTELEAWAVYLAIRYYWSRKDIRPDLDIWWTTAHRTAAGRQPGGADW